MAGAAGQFPETRFLAPEKTCLDSHLQPKQTSAKPFLNGLGGSQTGV